TGCSRRTGSGRRAAGGTPRSARAVPRRGSRPAGTGSRPAPGNRAPRGGNQRKRAGEGCRAWVLLLGGDRLQECRQHAPPKLTARANGVGKEGRVGGSAATTRRSRTVRGPV